MRSTWLDHTRGELRNHFWAYNRVSSADPTPQICQTLFQLAQLRVLSGHRCHRSSRFLEHGWRYEFIIKTVPKRDQIWACVWRDFQFSASNPLYKIDFVTGIDSTKEIRVTATWHFFFRNKKSRFQKSLHTQAYKWCSPQALRFWWSGVLSVVRNRDKRWPR